MNRAGVAHEDQECSSEQNEQNYEMIPQLIFEFWDSIGFLIMHWMNNNLSLGEKGIAIEGNKLTKRIRSHRHSKGITNA